MSTIAVLQYDRRKLTRLRNSLKAGSNEDVLRLVATSSFEERALAYIRDITPVGDRLSGFKERTGAGSDSLATTHMRDLWRIRRENAAGKLSFVITNMLETKGGERGRARFRSVERGSRGMTLKPAKKNYKFFSAQRGKFTFISKGMELKRPERAGLHLVDKAEDFIRTVLVPQVASAAKLRLDRRLANLT